jgi:hypothetical protein
MSSDDDTILSAYMDGQLDAAHQQRVEAALVASPRLSENLRALSAVRDLVAGLPREAGVDVSPEVMRRIRSLGRSPSRLGQSRSGAVWARRLAVGAGSVAVAAAILLMVTVLFSVPGNHGAATASHKAIDNVIADSGARCELTLDRRARCQCRCRFRLVCSANRGSEIRIARHGLPRGRAAHRPGRCSRHELIL